MLMCALFKRKNVKGVFRFNHSFHILYPQIILNWLWIFVWLCYVGYMIESDTTVCDCRLAGTGREAFNGG